MKPDDRRLECRVLLFGDRQARTVRHAQVKPSDLLHMVRIEQKALVAAHQKPIAHLLDLPEARQCLIGAVHRVGGRTVGSGRVASIIE